MTTLETAIKELYEIEPFWKRCNPCCSKGKCCEGAKIDPSRAEQKVIAEYALSLGESEKMQLCDNINSGRFCKYHTPEKCLIHNVRPEVCQYTPYQCVINKDNKLLYSFVGSDENDQCVFQSIKRQLTPDEAESMRKQKYLLLENFGRKTYYLSLNWLIQNQVI